MTVMGDALMNGLSDAGSIPARSTKKEKSEGTDFSFLLYMSMIIQIGKKNLL